MVRDLAQRAHLEARQSLDIRRDLAQRMRASEGPFTAGQSIWYWNRDMSKIRGGEWLKGKVTTEQKPPMVTIDCPEASHSELRVNQTKVRKNPDTWHDVVIPGLDGADGTCEVPCEPPESGQEEQEGLYMDTVLDPDFWVCDDSGEVLQCYCENDKLSALFGGLVSVSEPMDLSLIHI